MKIFKLVLITLLFSKGSIAGGGQIGNGADAIVCSQGFRFNVELLDIFEARVLLGKNWAQEYGASPDSSHSKWMRDRITSEIKRILGPLDLQLPLKSLRLRQYLDSFFDEAIFVSGIELTDISDSLQIALPGGCKLAQLVVQSPNPLAGQKRYTINEDLWKLMDSESRIGTVLHEIIYRDQLILGHKDSRWTRYFNALLFSNSIADMSPKEINDVIKKGASESFIRKGLTLLGPLSKDQNIYQIVESQLESGVPINIVDGRFSISEDRILDFTTATHSNVFGIGTKGTYSAELDVNLNVKKAYMARGEISKNVSISTYLADDYSYKSFIVDGLSSTGDILIQENLANIHFRSSNGIILESWIYRNIKKAETLESWLSKFVCYQGCRVPKATVIFANGKMRTTADIRVKSVAGEISEIGFIWHYGVSPNIKIRIPGNTDPNEIENLYPFSLLPGATSFNPNGQFRFNQTFYEIYSDKYRLVLKDGTIIPLLNHKQYHFEFDEDGNLLRATVVN